MASISGILDRAVRGERLGLEEGIAMLASNDVISLGQAADLVRRRFHPQEQVTFVIDRNINYTNVCLTGCRFCAFFRGEDHPEAYILSKEELTAKIQETVDCGGTQVLIQGGLHPKLGLDYYLDLLRFIKSKFKIHIHSFSPPEVMHMVKLSGLPLEEVLGQLQEAGLDSLPGGGAEILDNRVRHYISPKKITWEEWMEVMLTAHRLGMKTTATMMFGSVETLEERVLHILRVREAQDKGGGFTAFIPWSFQPANTDLGGPASSGIEYLKTLAVARILLDNVANIQASWVTQGAKMAQVALTFGANDFGGTMLEENVVRAAGVTNRVPLKEIIHSIKEAGKIPVQRTTAYEVIKIYT